MTVEEGWVNRHLVVTPSTRYLGLFSKCDLGQRILRGTKIYDESRRFTLLSERTQRSQEVPTIIASWSVRRVQSMDWWVSRNGGFHSSVNISRYEYRMLMYVKVFLELFVEMTWYPGGFNISSLVTSLATQLVSTSWEWRNQSWWNDIFDRCFRTYLILTTGHDGWPATASVHFAIYWRRVLSSDAHSRTVQLISPTPRSFAEVYIQSTTCHTMRYPCAQIFEPSPSPISPQYHSFGQMICELFAATMTERHEVGLANYRIWTMRLYYEDLIVRGKSGTVGFLDLGIVVLRLCVMYWSSKS